jgi:putative hydrolase of the HAD superfamily
MTFSAILFDLGDTLIRLHPFPDDLETQVDRYLASATDLPNGLTGQAILAGLRGASGRLDDGREANLVLLLASLLRETSVESADEHAARIARILHLGDVRRFEAPAGLRRNLVSFRERGLRLGLVSNTTTDPRLLRAFLHAVAAEDVFETAVFSVEHGYKKPHPSIYRAALEALDTPPSSTLFVGDRVREDVRGPQEVGMRAVLTREYRKEDPAGAPDAVIDHLEQLHAVLDQLSIPSDE